MTHVAALKSCLSLCLSYNIPLTVQHKFVELHGVVTCLLLCQLSYHAGVQELEHSVCLSCSIFCMSRMAEPYKCDWQGRQDLSVLIQFTLRETLSTWMHLIMWNYKVRWQVPPRNDTAVHECSWKMSFDYSQYVDHSLRQRPTKNMFGSSYLFIITTLQKPYSLTI